MPLLGVDLEPAMDQIVVGQPAVLRLLHRQLADPGGRYRLFCDLAAHEAEGIRFLREAEPLDSLDCGNWNRRAHLRDERRHLNYFVALAKRELPEAGAPIAPQPPLSAKERSVFENPDDFFISLYVAETFSAAYLRVVEATWPNRGSSRAVAVLNRVLEDEERHARWARSAIGKRDDACLQKMHAQWRDLEIAALEALLLNAQGSA